VVTELGHAGDTNRDDRGPLLLTTGGADHVVPPSLAAANAQLYSELPDSDRVPRVPGPVAFRGRGTGGESPAATQPPAETEARHRRMLMTRGTLRVRELNPNHMIRMAADLWLS
jgi:hypothetical protein